MKKELPEVNQQKIKIPAFDLKDFIHFYSTLLLLTLANFISAQNNAALIPNLSPTEQVTFNILVDGNPLDNNFEIFSFFVKQKENEPQFAGIEFHFYGDLTKLTILNRKVEIRLGYQNINETVFLGETKKYNMHERAGVGVLPVFSVDCGGEAGIKLTQSKADAPEIELLRGASILESELSKNNFGEVEGRIRIMGINSLKPGSVIGLEGFNTDFNGIYKISELMHEFGENNWFTVIRVTNI